MEDYRKLIQEIEEDRAERLRANLMMAQYAFNEAHSWIPELDPDPRTCMEFANRQRAEGVRKWLRDFWSGDPSLPLPRPRWLYLSNGTIKELDEKPIEIKVNV